MKRSLEIRNQAAGPLWFPVDSKPTGMVQKNPYDKAIQNATIILVFLALEMRSVRWCCLELHHFSGRENRIQWSINVPFVLSYWWIDRNFVIKSASITKLQFSMPEEMVFLVEGSEEVRMQPFLLICTEAVEFHCLTSFPLVLVCSSSLTFILLVTVKFMLWRRLLVGKL